MKRTLKYGLQLLSVVLIVVILFYFKFIDLGVLGKILKQPVAVILAGTLIFASYISGALRWSQILKAQGFVIPFFRLFNIYTVSVFSLIFLPGGTGSSDGVRAMLILRAVPSGQGRAVLTVFFDRFCAVFTLSVVAAIFGMSNGREPTVPIYWLRIMAVALPVLLLGGALFAYVLTLYLKNSPWAKKFEQKLVWRVISAAAGFIELMALNPWRILSALFLSVVTTTLLIGTVTAVGIMSAVPHLTVVDLGEATSLSMLANGVPITPGGLGVGEAVFNQICTWLAAPGVDYPYGTIFLAYRVISLVTACYGLIPLVNMGQLLRPRRP